MKSKIVAGIIIAIVIVIGIGFGLNNSDESFDGNSSIEIDEVQVTEPLENDEGKQFTIELSDSVQTTGP